MTKNQIAKFIVDKYYEKLCRPCLLCCGLKCACPKHNSIFFYEEEKEQCVSNIRQALINAEKERYGNGNDRNKRS